MSRFQNENAYRKFQKVPSSTPNNVTVTSRKSIHYENSLSPITATDDHDIRPRLLSKEHSEGKERANSILHSDRSDSDESSNEEVGSSLHYASESSDISKTFSQKLIDRSNCESDFNSPIKYGCLSIIIALIVGICILFKLEEAESIVNVVTIEQIQENFPLQSEDTWNAFETGIREVNSFNKPSVFLLLYDDEAKETLNRLLLKVTRYATCVLKNCEVQPIVLTSTNLSTQKAKSDYGYIIDKFKPELEQNGVMVVKNLDEVPGEVAQAFHSMCDEYTPLVAKTAFFFTMKVTDLKTTEKRDLQVVEEMLRRNWNDMEDDIFYPLLTRISNMVLRVVAEKT